MRILGHITAAISQSSSAKETCHLLFARNENTIKLTLASSSGLVVQTIGSKGSTDDAGLMRCTFVKRLGGGTGVC